jgi:hypothetical protein
MSVFTNSTTKTFAEELEDPEIFREFLAWVREEEGNNE